MAHRIIAPMRRIALLFLAIVLLVSCSQVQTVSPFTIIAHPDGPLFVGDTVSFEILPRGGNGSQASSVSLSFEGEVIGKADFAPFGLGKRNQATLWWTWDTHNLKPGKYDLLFTLQPGDDKETVSFRLFGADRVPAPEPGAVWDSMTTACCILHYISGTAAARDISILARSVDMEAAMVSNQVGSKLSSPMDIIFMPRVIGQGGFTWGSVYVSYLDGNYIGNDMDILFHHEFVHYFDSARGGNFLPIIFQEGLAVYLTGGHFKLEPIIPRAAAMLDLGWYILLTSLANDFYDQQHDLGYLEAGALVDYLVGTYGWEKYNEFYRNIPFPEKIQTNGTVIDSALRIHLGVTLVDLESNFLDYLRSSPITETDKIDLKETVSFYESVRRYQELLDPSAFFLYAWLPNGADMRQRGIVADLLRRPGTWDNRLIESLLIRAHDDYFNGDYHDADTILKWTNEMMDILEP